MTSGPACVAYKLFGFDEFTYHLCPMICSLYKQEKANLNSLVCQAVVRLSGYPIVHASDPR